MSAATFSHSTTALEVATVFAAQIAGKQVLITGPSLGGIGAETAVVLGGFIGDQGALLLAGRSLKNLEATKAAVLEATPSLAPAQIVLLVLDLSERTSVIAAAAELAGKSIKLDVLLNNGAIMFPPYASLPSYGNAESTFGTNHLGHFLFAGLLARSGVIEKSRTRVVNVASTGHEYSNIRWDDPGFKGGEKYDKYEAYGQAKSANMLFAVALAARGWSAYSLHPGAINTNLQRTTGAREMFGLICKTPGLVWQLATGAIKFKTLQQGAATSLVAAFSTELKGKEGSYLDDCQPHNERAKPYALDNEGAEKLWTLSEGMVGDKFAL